MAEFTYVGMDRAQWLDQVKAGLPVTLVPVTTAPPVAKQV